MNKDITLVLLNFIGSKVVPCKSFLKNFVNLFLFRRHIHNHVKSMVGAYAAHAVKILDTLCKSLTKSVNTVNLNIGCIS